MSGKRERAFGPVHLLFLVFVTTAGGLFCFKLFAFLSTIKKDELAGFAFDPIVTYGFVAAGFGLLLAWAYLSGQFRNVEQPKHDMLSDYEARERHDLALIERDA